MHSTRATLLLITLALAVVAAPVGAAVDGGQGQGTPDGSPGASDAPGRDRDNSTGDQQRGGPPGGDGPPGRSDNRSKDVRAEHQRERSQFYREQAAEKREFQQAQQERRRNASQQELNETERQAIEEELARQRQAFLEAQRAEREAFLEAQRSEQREVELDRRSQWAAGRPNDLPAPELLGAFGASGDDALGRYVTLNYSLDPATARDVRAAGQLLFDAVGLTNGTAEARLAGATLRLEGSGGALTVHDNPTAIVRVDPAGGAGFVLDLADYLEVEGAGARWNVSDGAGLAGSLHFERAPTLDAVNRTFTGAGEARFVARSLQPHLAASNAHRDAIHDAIDARDVGAEVTLVDAEGAVAEETLLYEDMNVTVVEAGEGEVRVRVDGEGDTGKTLVLNVDQKLLREGRLEFSYFDVLENETVEVPILEASSIQDALEPNDDSTPEYWVVEDSDGVQVLVTVPHFSVHEVHIQSVALQPPPSVALGALAAVGFVAVATARMFRRPGE